MNFLLVGLVSSALCVKGNPAVSWRRFLMQSTGPVVQSVSMPQSPLSGNSSSSTFVITVNVTSVDEPSGYLNLTAPTGYVAARAALAFAAAASSAWIGTATLPLNYYMPEGSYAVSGLNISNGSGQTSQSRNDAVAVTTAFPGASYGNLGLCAGANVGYASFIPKSGVAAARVECCSPDLTCALSGGVGQAFSTGTFLLTSPAVVISALQISVTQALLLAGAATVDLRANATLTLAAGAVANQSTSGGPVTIRGCSTGGALTVSMGASLAPTGSVTLDLPVTIAGTVAVPANAALALPCGWTLSGPQAAVVVGSGSQLTFASDTSCANGTISGSGQLVVTGGTFTSLNCNITTSSLSIGGPSSTSAAKFTAVASVATTALFCGQWPPTTLTGSAVVTIPACSSSCPCSTVQLRQRVAVVNGALTQGADATLLFDMSSGAEGDYGCLDVTGTLTAQGSLSVLLGLAVNNATVEHDLCLVRFLNSAAGGCLVPLLNQTSWSNGPSGYNVSVVCVNVGGPLPYTILLRLTWAGPVTTYDRQPLDQSLAWALFAVTLVALMGMCGVIIVKICRRSAVSDPGTFDDRDTNVACMVQEADPFIPALTQPIKGGSRPQ